MYMHISVYAILISIILFSCQENKTIPTPDYDELYGGLDTTHEAPSFFPVGDFIESKIKEVVDYYPKVKFFNKQPNGSDSVETTSKKMTLFLDEFRLPRIDSVGMSPYFSEKKFRDETLHWVSLSYDPSVKIPDSIPWRRWDVHIDPETGEVKRIYLVKQVSATRLGQFTWLPATGCKMTFIDQTNIDSPYVHSEMEFKWVY